MAQALVSLGSNLGDRRRMLDEACAALRRTAGIERIAESSWYATQPVGGPGDQEEFLNGAALVETSLAPQALLAELQRIELEQGRRRDVPWGPRTLDLDLLLYDDVVLRTPTLTLPHPRLSFRKFVLRGASEVAGHMLHPILRRSLASLLRHLETTPRYVAFVGHTEGFRTQLASECAEAARGRLVEPTPPDIPAFSELSTTHSPDHTVAIKYMAARFAAVAQSLSAAVDDAWLVDDSWWVEEAGTLIHRSENDVRPALVALCSSPAAVMPTPRLLAALGTSDAPASAAAPAVKQAVPFEVDLPPVVELDISRREEAIAEFAAALDAAA